jgi:hypothetical protein
MILLTALLAIFIIVAQGAKKPRKRPARYKKFTINQKLEVVGYASSHNICMAARLYQINRMTISSWTHQVEALRRQAGNACRLSGGGRKTKMDSNMEDELVTWVMGYREQRKGVSRDDIARHAVQISVKHGVVNFWW